MTGSHAERPSKTDAALEFSRCPNRRLYSRAHSGYVTYEVFEEHLRAGQDVRVIDKETGQDVTALVVANQISERIRQGKLRPSLERLIRILLDAN